MAYSISIEPSSASNQESGHDGVLLTIVDGGPPRMRKDKAQSNTIVDLVWNVVENFDFLALIFAHREHRHEEWEITMVSKTDGYGTYLCRVLPGSFGWRPNSDLGRSVFCSVEVLGSVTL